MYKIVYSKKAIKQTKYIKAAKLDYIVKNLIDLISKDPFTYPPVYEKLRWDLIGAYARRINLQHCLVYKVYRDKKIVSILSMWGHYDD